MNKKFILSLIASILIFSCGDEFDPPSLLKDSRILAVSINPETQAFLPDYGDFSQGFPVPNNKETLHEVFLFKPDEDKVKKVLWTSCPIHLGPNTGYKCVSESCQSIIDKSTADDSLSFKSNPLNLLLKCGDFLESYEQRSGANSNTNANEEKESCSNERGFIDFLYKVDIELESGRKLSAASRLPVWFEKRPLNTLNPKLKAITIGGVKADLENPSSFKLEKKIKPGEELEIEIDIDETSLEEEIAADCTKTKERPLISYYSTQGKFDKLRKGDLKSVNKWSFEELKDLPKNQFYFVLRDYKAGQTVYGPFSIELSEK